MSVSRVTGFNAEAMKASMLKIAVDESNKRLIDYAKKKIVEIGNKIKSYHGAHGLDRTGNLLNSLCWGVCYDGKMVDSGFFREPIIKTIFFARVL